MQKVFLSLFAISTFWVFTLWHITLVLYSKRKSSITAPAGNKTYLQASETQRYKERFFVFFFPCRELWNRSFLGSFPMVSFDYRVSKMWAFSPCRVRWTWFVEPRLWSSFTIHWIILCKSIYILVYLLLQGKRSWTCFDAFTFYPNVTLTWECGHSFQDWKLWKEI